MLEVAYGTGVRVSELVGLSINDLMLEEGLVTPETELRPIEPGASQIERLLAELNPPQREAVRKVYYDQYGNPVASAPVYR